MQPFKNEMRFQCLRTSAAMIARCRAFTILEVMIAMGIFVIAFVAVAAIFPAGAYLQKQTMAEIQGKSVAESVKALVSAKPFSAATLDGGVTAGSLALSRVDPTDLSAAWPLGDRSFPSTAATPQDGSYFWVPLVRRTVVPATNEGHWQVFCFVLRRDSNVTWNKSSGTWAADTSEDGVPGVRSTDGTASGDTFTFTTGGYNNPRVIRVGDQIIDKWGTIYLVNKVDNDWIKVTGSFMPRSSTTIMPDEIWFAPPEWPSSAVGRPSPTLQIIGPITNAVKP